jgi:hypothetical protein
MENIQKKLFDIPIQNSQYTCKDCKHRQRWQCNSKVIQYCGVRKSNRTENGLLKIKCKNTACSLLEKENI